jgi:capsular exopolysaccharide synthesis family protein
MTSMVRTPVGAGEPPAESNARRVEATHPRLDDAPAPFDVAGSDVHTARLPPAILASNSPASEEFRVLRSKVYAIGERRPFRCIGMVSASRGEGKTTVALGLAAILARAPGCRVLVIEADLRKPSIERYLGMSRSEGLVDWLRGTVTHVPLRRVVPPKFCLLSAGRAPFDHPELLASERMVRILEAGRHEFDYVIVDCPPLIPVADTVILQDLLDGFLWVVRSRRAPRETLRKAAGQLKPERVQGIVFNDHHQILSRYESYGYGSYGHTE